VAIVVATVVAAHVRLRVTVAADAPLPAAAAVIRRRAVAPPTVAAGPHTAEVVLRTAAVVAAADMGGNTALDSFPA
jgi:hypothetical protein